MYDTIIIGAGPAGMTAAIYAARREMKTLIISKDVGGQVALAFDIENYPGFISINSADLIKKMQEHVRALGVEIRNEEVKTIEKQDDRFILYANKDKFETKTLILAMGLSPRRLAIAGEKEFAGKGVSYCANCDAPLYKNKTVAVVGGGNSALDAAEVLSKIAKRVYLIHRSGSFAAFDGLVDEVKAKKNIELLLDSEIKEITGGNKLEKLKIFNSKENSSTELDADGLFIEVGRIAHTDLVDELVKRDARGQILVDEKCQTGTDGVFAAGDVTQIEYKQITTAAGQGTIAALAAYQYLQLKKGETAVVLDRSVKNHSKPK